jgi:hypothetical protein
MNESDRYDRQRRLPEVGDAGQARLAAACVVVRGSDGAIIEAEYLHRAGVERLSITPGLEPKPFRHEQFFRFWAPRRIGAGAWRAIAQMREILGMDPG